MKVSAIICAAGRGERAGFNKNKLLAPLYGEPALYHTLKKFDMPEIGEVVVTASGEDADAIRALCSPFGYTVVTGGSTRTESVKNALDAVSGEIVLIHDGARPFVSQKLIRRCIAEVERASSAVCAVKASDTAVYAKEGYEPVDRNFLYLIQTPQGFYTQDIRRAYSAAGDGTFTDDSAVYARYIAKPNIIEGERSNVKLTFKEDFDRIPLPPPCGGETGFGVDVHAFGEGTFVTLGGVKIACDGALIAHSDGDVLCHAVTDALLSAAGLDDIGHYFPDTDEKWRGADSLDMLRRAADIAGRAGYVPVNLSASVQAEKPRLSAHIPAIRKNLASALGIDVSRAAVSAGTCEGLGFVGAGSGICAYAYITVKKTDGDKNYG